MFGIGRQDNTPAALLESESQRSLRMDQIARGHTEASNPEITGRNLSENLFRGRLPKSDREKPSSHHPVQTGFGAFGAEMRIERDLSLGRIQRSKKGKPLNVIEMKMSV